MTRLPGLPAAVREATEQHLEAAEEVAPGLIASLYLTGSVALGDYQPSRSDIDFLAFTSRPTTDPDVPRLLSAVHARLPTATSYDGNYVSVTEIPAVPDDERRAPHMVNGEFREAEPNHQLTPATWAEFTRYAIVVRGPEAAELGIRVPHERLQAWTLGNLNGYWKTTAVQGRQALQSHDPGEPMAADLVAWMALGPARLYYTLATGDIASKSVAGRCAIDLFPSHAEVVTAALAWRASGHGAFTASDWSRSAELTRHHRRCQPALGLPHDLRFLPPWSAGCGKPD